MATFGVVARIELEHAGAEIAIWGLATKGAVLKRTSCSITDAERIVIVGVTHAGHEA